MIWLFWFEAVDEHMKAQMEGYTLQVKTTYA